MIVRQEEQIFLLFFSAILIEADKMEDQCHRKDTVIFHKYLSCRNQGLMIRWKRDRLHLRICPDIDKEWRRR